MCHFRDDTIEATELERELRDEYVIESREESDPPETEEPTILADGGGE